MNVLFLCCSIKIFFFINNKLIDLENSKPSYTIFLNIFEVLNVRLSDGEMSVESHKLIKFRATFRKI